MSEFSPREIVSELDRFIVGHAEAKRAVAVALVMTDAGRLKQVEAHARAQLGPLAPKRYFVMDSLPRTQTGKLRRQALSSQFSSKPRDA